MDKVRSPPKSLISRAASSLSCVPMTSSLLALTTLKLIVLLVNSESQIESLSLRTLAPRAIKYPLEE